MENRPSDGDRGRLSRRDFLAAGTASLGAMAGCLVRGESSDLTGEIVIDGSNTVLRHTALLAYEFQWRNNRVQIPVRGSGTGAGFQRFCDGETDIQNASRAVTDDELERCQDYGVDAEDLELEALLDGLAVMISAENDWVDHLTTDELRELWRSGSPIETWRDLRDEWPDREIQFYGRPPSSGTFDSFTEIATGEKGNIRGDYSASADTNVIVRGVSGNRDAIGFGGLGYYEENKDDLRVVALKDGEDADPIPPTEETIETGEYYLSRPMFIYINPERFDREVVREFAKFCFDPVDDDIDTDEDLAWTQWAAREVGYYAIDDETVEESRAKIRQKTAEFTQ